MLKLKLSHASQILEQYNAGPDYETETFALPGGSETSPSSSTHNQRIPLHEIAGLELPQKHITDFLIHTYLDSVHWFMMVFHEPSFRNSYERIMVSRMGTQNDTGFVVLLMMVLAIGCRCACGIEY